MSSLPHDVFFVRRIICNRCARYTVHGIFGGHFGHCSYRDGLVRSCFVRKLHVHLGPGLIITLDLS